jgi:uncharacterized membrane protein
MATTEKGPLDGLYRDTNIAILVIFGLCCNLIAFILSLIGFLTAKDEKAKHNAMICLIVSIVSMVLGTILQFSGIFARLMVRQ